MIGLDYTQILFAAHPFDQMTWRVSAQTGRWEMQDTNTGARPAVVHWNGRAQPSASLGTAAAHALCHFSHSPCLIPRRSGLPNVTGPAHWCKTEAGGFGHNFVNDYQRAAIKVVGIWHTPLHCDALQVVEIVTLSHPNNAAPSDTQRIAQHPPHSTIYCLFSAHDG